MGLLVSPERVRPVPQSTLFCLLTRIPLILMTLSSESNSGSPHSGDDSVGLACDRSTGKLGLDEPIAIIGIGCRLPGGVNDGQSYWNLLSDGVDAISQTPADRWSLQKFYAPGAAVPGKTQSQWGGYLEDIEQFDPQLFGISPREAASMDPQQRLLLEVAWRALEDAGQPLEKIAGMPVAVFTGISSFDYAVAGLSYQDRGVITPYSNTGGSSSIAANRISYCFDLRGPSVAVDTACSSSLVAVHLACESLRRGETQLALAGGVNALLLPDFYVAFSQLGVLSPEGRCRTFDAGANGYVRSEGAGMVLLKPLSAALRDGDLIYATIRGTALNQDGRTPGMTVPSQAAQEALLRSACQRAGVQPAEIQYVEAHGTGTPVGDPIEANALAAVLNENRPVNQPCLIGSVKTNIGHLEAGAGIASLIKVALALHHQQIPAHLHFEHPNPQINLKRLNLRIPLATEPWPETDGTRLAGVNGFGYGGANAHVLLQAAPPSSSDNSLSGPTARKRIYEASTNGNGNGHRHGIDHVATNGEASSVLLPISARSPAALAQVASSMATWLELKGTSFSLAQIASYAAHRRSHLECRAAVSGTNHHAWIEQLRHLADTHDASAATKDDKEIESRLSVPQSIEQRHPPANPLTPSQIAKGVLFVCSGQGPQWWAMGRGVLNHNAVFRAAIEKCDREFAKYVSWSLLEELSRGENESRMQQTSIAQPSIFAIQVALAATWESLGIRAAAVVGHSVGEIAAAYLSGALSWQDACCVAIHRGRTMDLATSQGGMLAVGLSPAESAAWIRGKEDQVSLAAINGPTSVTISGDAETIESLADQLDEAGIFCRHLSVEYAFHSPQMMPVREPLLRCLANIRPQPASTPIISTVTGAFAAGTQFDAEYWWKNVRQSVRFADAMQVAAEAGFGVVVELGPHPVLAYSITECFQQQRRAVRAFPSLHRERDDSTCIAESLGSLYTIGVDLDWSQLYPPPAVRIPLPAYPFQRQRCWSESRESRITRLDENVHPLLGESTHHFLPAWQSRIDLKLQDYLAEHCVRETCMLPAAAIIEMAAAAARQITQQDEFTLERLSLKNPCILTADRPQHLETVYHHDRKRIEIAARETEESHWQDLATVQISEHACLEDWDPEALATAEQRCRKTFKRQQCYAYCERLGLDYGPRFQGISHGSRRRWEAVAEVDLSSWLGDSTSAYHIHPAVLDSCFHAMITADAEFDQQLGGLYLPVEIQRITFLQAATSRVTVHVRLRSKDAQRMVADIDILDQDGHPCVLLRGFVSQRVGTAEKAETIHDLIYGYRWVAAPTAPSQSSDTDRDPQQDAPPRRWCVFADRTGVADALVDLLRSRGDDVIRVNHGDAWQQRNANDFVVNPENRDDFRKLLHQIRFPEQESSDGSPVVAVTDLVYLWAFDTPSNSRLTTEQLEQSTILTTLAPLHLVQGWNASDEHALARLAFVTCGAQDADGSCEEVSVAQTPLIGLGRVVISEYARLACRLIDLPGHDTRFAVASLYNELTHCHDDEDEVMYRDGTRWLHRFTPLSDETLPTGSAGPLPSRLQIGRSSGIAELHYRTIAQNPLDAHHVEIEVLATGLNFSDVMKALDLYPGLPQGPTLLGAECSGRITRLGPKVTQWQVGDEVMAVAPGSFATHVMVNEALVAKKPSGLSHAQAATIPIAFLTAEYALVECARMREGDDVLIHSASGGVGLAAMQLAKLRGARVFATAGSEAKREYVRKLGAAEVMNSRDLAFANQIRSATDGQGVDIVLNSLAGEAIAKGISVLKVGGRFLEIGKRDIYADASLSLEPFRNNLALFAIDLDQWFQQQPARMGDLLRSIADRFEAGELQPLPVSTYPADQTQEAFRFMQQGKQIGKVVVEYSSRPSQVYPGATSEVTFRADATYWIAGGLGGFGIEIARWMVDRGARHLVLSGRSTTLPAATVSVLEELRSRGARVEVMSADITRVEDVRKTLRKIDQQLPRLRGVFHTAMVLEDRLLVDLDQATLQRVLRPKVLGGWNLHRETLDRSLDHFVLFSSLSSVFGHAGQANYSAANALLDGLAQYRRSQQLPACVINWGHLGEVGYLAQRKQLGERLERQGVLSFTVEQATNCLGAALQMETTQMSVLRIDWSLWRGLGITSRVSPRFAHLIRQVAPAKNQDKRTWVTATEIRQAPVEQQSALVCDLLSWKAGMLLGIDHTTLPRDRSLLELGLDSLMAVEMRNWIESQIEINLPISALMRSASLNHLTQNIAQIIDQSQVPGNDQPTRHDMTISGNQADVLLDQLPEMADEDVDQLLNQMLRQPHEG